MKKYLVPFFVFTYIIISCNSNHDKGIADDDENNSLDTMTPKKDSVYGNDSLTPTEINSMKGTGTSTNSGPGTDPKISTGGDATDTSHPSSGVNPKSKIDTVPSASPKKNRKK
jgi:hypothetical protein